MCYETSFVFVSNYINHHQIPFCNAMRRIMKDSFAFIQTEPMEEERVSMGWEQTSQPYLKLYYQEPELCRRLIENARIVFFGGSDDESFIAKRLERKRPVVRYSERLYKTGQWKAVSPRGLLKKYHDHTRHRNAPVYLLCAGAYVASDFHIVRAYPEKMYQWGYFPETRHYDVERLLAEKGWPAGGENVPEEPNGGRLPYLLWAARMIGWKHPELAMETAKRLKERGLAFHMDIVGDGDLMEELRAMRFRYGLEDCVDLPGFLTPDRVRERMEKADIFLFTSDRQEGWGAVANEAMNSGCALVADHLIGAIPYLVEDGKSGMIYRDGDKSQLFALAEELARDREQCRRLGRSAYRRITETWNAEEAAERLSLLCVRLGLLDAEALEIADVWRKLERFASGVCEGGAPAPCAPATALSERYESQNAGRNAVSMGASG